MAGTGNIQVLRVARSLRKRCSNEITYGNHMAVHMTIGFLFLGGGRLVEVIFYVIIPTRNCRFVTQRNH